MKLVFTRGLAAVLVATAFAATAPTPATAATPKDFLVIATLLDEFISLDPAEVYELLPQEYVASTYDRLIRVNLDKPSEFKGDLAESWREGETDYASVAMRFALIDKTLERGTNRLVAGSETPIEATEIWTFVRPKASNWELSAIQQA